MVATVLAWWGWIGFGSMAENGPTNHPFQSWRLIGFAVTVVGLVIAASAVRLREAVTLWVPTAVIAGSVWIILSGGGYRGVSTVVITACFVGGFLVVLGLARFVRRFAALRSRS